jgi:hypothetical protein
MLGQIITLSTREVFSSCPDVEEWESVLMLTVGINGTVASQRPNISPDGPRMSGLVQKNGPSTSCSTAITPAERAESSHRAGEPPEDWDCVTVAKITLGLVATTPQRPASQVTRPLSGNHVAFDSASRPSLSLAPVRSESRLPVRSIAEQNKVQNGGFQKLADILSDTTNRVAVFSGHPGLSIEHKADLDHLISLLRHFVDDAAKIDRSLANVAV